MTFRKWGITESPRTVAHSLRLSGCASAVDPVTGPLRTKARVFGFLCTFFTVVGLAIVWFLFAPLQSSESTFIGSKDVPVPVVARDLYRAVEMAHRNHFMFARYTIVDPMIVENSDVARSVMEFTHTATITEDTTADEAYPYRRFVIRYDVVDRVTRKLMPVDAIIVAKRGNDIRDHVVGASVNFEPVMILPVNEDDDRRNS